MSWRELFEAPKEVEQEEQAAVEEPELFDIINDMSERSGDKTRKFLKENGRLPSTYSAFMVAKAFANYYDTVLWANEWNKYYLMPDEAQFFLLSGSTANKRRFSKWYKPHKEELIAGLALLFGMTEREMKINLPNVPKEVITELEEKLALEKKNGRRK